MLPKFKINNISSLQFFQLLRFGTLLLISIVFTKSKLNTDAIGNYEYFLFVAALTCSFWISGILQSFLPLFKNNNTFKQHGEKSPEFYNVFVLISLFSVLVVIVLIGFRFSYSEIKGKEDSIPYFWLLLIYVLFSSPSYLIEYLYLLKDKANWIIKYGLVTFAVQFVLVALPAILGADMKFSIIGLVVISIIRYAWLLVLLKKYAQFTISKAFIKEHLHLASPLIITSLLGGSAQYVDGFLVLNKFDATTFAIFRYGAKEFPLILLMANAMSNAMIPVFSEKEKLAESLASLRNKTARLMHLLFPVVIIFIVFSEWLYPRIFNENFAGSAIIFNIYLLLIISRLIFPHTILIGLKKTKIVLYASVIELGVNVILSIIFIHFWGIAGVAFATFIAYVVQKIIFLFYNKTVLGINPNQYIPMVLWLIYSFFTLAVFYAVY